MAKPYCVGIELRAPDGSPLSLRGWNYREATTEEDFKWLKSKGYSIVRLVIYWSSMEPTEGSINWSGLDNSFAWCKKYGLYAILDVHQWKYSPYFTDVGGVGFPKWLVQAGGYPISSAGRQAFSDDFFLKRGYGATTWSKFIGFWQKILTRYDADFCEILNEPLTGASHANNVYLAAYDRYKEIIPIMRAIRPDACIICHDVFYDSSSTFVSRVKSVTPLPFPNLLWTRSFYTQYDGSSVSAIDSKLNLYKQAINDYFEIPHIISECGLQPGQTNYSQSIVDLDNEYRKVLNSGTGIINSWQYYKGVRDGWQGPRNADGSDSWAQPYFATWLGDIPPIIQFILTVQAPSGNGSSAPPAGTYQYNQGQSINLVATPTNNWSFNNWLIDGQTAMLQNPVLITMNMNHTAKPIFIEEPPTPPDDSCQEYKDEILMLQALIIEQNTEIAALSTQVTNLSGQISILNQQLTTLSMDNQILQNTISGLKSKMDAARATLVY